MLVWLALARADPLPIPLEPLERFPELAACDAACDGSCVRDPDGWVCEQPAFAITAARVRKAPETGRVTAVLPAGTPLGIRARQGDWVQTKAGWVHTSLVGAAWVAPPDRESPWGLRGRIAGWKPDHAVLVEVVDRGNVGAVANAEVYLCTVPLADPGARACLSADAPADYVARPTPEHVTYLWNQHGLAVQDALVGSVRTNIVPLDADAAGLTLTRAGETGVRTVEHGGRTVWTATQPDARGAVEHVTRLGDRWLLLHLVEHALGGCCPETSTVVIDLKAVP